MSNFTESVVEEAALEWLEGLGYTILHGPEIAAGEPAAERDDSGYRDVILETAAAPGARTAQSGAAARGHRRCLPAVDRAGEPSLVTRNHALHQKLVEESRSSTRAQTAPSAEHWCTSSTSIIRRTTTGWR